MGADSPSLFSFIMLELPPAAAEESHILVRVCSLHNAQSAHSPHPSPYPTLWAGHSCENRLKPQFRTHHYIYSPAFKAMFLTNRTFSSEPRTFRPQAQSLRRCYGLPRRHQNGLISETRTSSGRHEANNQAAIPAPAKPPSSPLLPSPETEDAPTHLYDLVQQQAGLILSMVDPSLKD